MPGARRRVAQGEGERQAAVGDEREGVSRRAGQRLGGEEWEHLLAEPAAQELLRRGVELPETRDAHARGRELPGAERVEAAILALHEWAQPDGDGVELLLRREVVGRARRQPGGHGVLEARHLA